MKLYLILLYFVSGVCSFTDTCFAYSTQELQQHLGFALSALPKEVQALHIKKPVRVEIGNISKNNYETYAKYSNYFSRPTITFNRAWLKSIADSKDAGEQILRKMVHELAHYWDDQLNHKFSNDSKLLNILGWKNQRFGIRPKNKMSQRLAHPSELENRKEAFAYNIESFYFEPDYNCRHPVAFEYISKNILNKNVPSYLASCSEKLPILLSDSSSYIFENIDIKKIVAIDYLVAAPAPAVESRFGHSMLRIIFCDNTDSESILNCRKKIESQIVVQFGASITDKQMSYLTGIGLFESYPSTIRFSTFLSMKQQYNDAEQRNLYSYPLLLDSNELQRALLQMVYLAWAYEGEYRFFSTNCSTEILDLLRSVLWNNDNLFRSNIHQPMELLNLLIRSSLIDSSLQDPINLKKHPYSFFPASTEAMKQALEVVKSMLSYDKMSFEDYKKIRVQERTNLFQCHDITCRADLNSLIAGLYLQSIVTAHVKTSIEARLYNEVLKLDSLSEIISSEQLELLRQFMLQFRSPGVLAGGQSSYGIPNLTEVESLKSLLAEKQKLHEAAQNFNENILKYIKKSDLIQLQEEWNLQRSLNQTLMESTSNF